MVASSSPEGFGEIICKPDIRLGERYLALVDTNSEAVVWTQSLLPAKSATENALLINLPRQIGVELQARLRTVCARHNWVKLLAGALSESQNP